MMKSAHGFAEEHVGIGFLGAMSVELHKQPVGPAFDMNARSTPEPQAVERGRVLGRQIGVL
jgi:hypothetical protein